MSQANWVEYFRSPVTTGNERPNRALKTPGWLTDWESWLTLGLVMLVFLSVSRSVDKADWVPDMPSLTSLSFFAILAGFFLARVRLPEGVLHLAALAIGAPIIFLLTLQFMGVEGLRAGASEWWERWKTWIDVVVSGGISSDTMPFVMMVLAITWIAGYLCAWAIFRWQNAWLALVPGGIGLLTNISYLPGQWSIDFIIFLFGGMLLVARVHMQRKLREWQQTNTPYPDFISLTLLNVTTWVAIGAMVLAWWAPQANEVGPVAGFWNRVAGPISGDSDVFTRLFSGIDSKKEVPLHSFGDSLPLQGKVVLSNRIVAQAEFGEGVTPARALRGAVYDEYVTQGWRAGQRRALDLGPTEQPEPSAQNPQRAEYRDREHAQVTVVTETGTPRRTLLGVGVPDSVSINSRAELVTSDVIPDVSAIRARKDLKTGDIYVANGNISTASEEKLRGAGVEYPQWVRERYLQLPDDLPQRVRDLAAQLTAGRQAPLDKAKAIEEYLRTFPVSYDVRPVPPGRDAVDFFLFDEKKGYSDYQASAMVVLLRAVGVPARMAVGYTVDEFDLSVNRYLLREKHAYAWPEVFFPTFGWAEFAPYGEAPVVARAISDAPTEEPVLSDEAFTGEIPEPDFGPIDDSMPTGPFVVDDDTNVLKSLLPLLYALLAIAAVIGLGVVGVRFAWERGMSGLDYPSQLWEKTIRLASLLRVGPRPSQTPTEYSQSLRRTLPGTEGVDQVATSYLRSRYGRRDPDETEREQLDKAWRPLRNRLIKKVFRMK